MTINLLDTQPLHQLQKPQALPGFINDAFLDDPYPTYRALQEAGPLHWSDEFFEGAWLLTRHRDVEALLRDPRFSARRTGGWVNDVSADARAEFQALQRLYARSMLFLDGADHQRLRKLMNLGFRPDAIQRLAPAIERMVNERLDALATHSEVDFIEQVARPLPAQVMALLMGVESDALADFANWSDALADFIGAVRPTIDQARQAQTSLVAMGRYFEARLHSARPDEDTVISRLLQGVQEGQIEAGAELLSQCAMLLFAGNETTRNGLGNCLFHLLSQPALWRELEQTPARLPSAIKELLRFDSPVQYTGRRVATDLVLHGQTLRRGELVIGLIGAANRDPLRFAEACQIDLARRPAASLSFGSGPHVCIGASLTLLETEITLRSLMQRWPDLKLANQQAHWSRNALYRGQSKLTVSCCASSR